MSEIDLLLQTRELERRVRHLERLEYASGKSWREIRIDATLVKKGAAAPSVAERAVGASGGIVMPVLTFSKTTQQDCYFVVHSPMDLDASSPVYFHLMWQPGASWTAGYYLWKLEYLVKAENGATLLAGAPTTIATTAVTGLPANATTNIETEYPDAITIGADQLMLCHFYRDIADNADDIGCVTFFEIEYLSKLGGEAV